MFVDPQQVVERFGLGLSGGEEAAAAAEEKCYVVSHDFSIGVTMGGITS